MLGSMLGHYRVDAQLGAGGMGVVYRARDMVLGRDVALKVLAPHDRGDQTARERLLREARTASSLNHPHICTIHEIGEDRDQHFIVMELIEGRPLSKTIPPGGLPIETLLRYARQIAEALAHAHEHGILHRDLKSSNVAITPGGRAKVLDFGLARRFHEDELGDATRSRMSLTEAGAITGTLPYLAPEVLSGSPPDARSDLWALGVLLHEMATGALPFHGRSGFEITAAILREPPAPLAATAPPGLRAVITRCLAKDPGQRYQHANEVRAALEAVDSGVTAAQPVAPAPDRRRTRSVRWTLAAVAAIVGTAVTVAVVGNRLRREPALPPAATMPPSTDSRHAEAIEYFRRSWLFLGTRLDLPQARRMLEKALELDPHLAVARAEYAFTHLLLVDSGSSNDSAWLYKAEAELRRALQDDPALGRAHSVLAAVYLFQGRKDLMPAELELARKADPNDIDVDNWQLNYDNMNGDYASARAIAEDLIRREPLFFPARMNLGEILQQQGDPAGAIREQRKVLEQDAQNVYAIEKLSGAYMRAADHAAARRTLELARSQDRQNFQLRLCWALLLALEGKRAQALNELDADTLKYAEIRPFSTSLAAEAYALTGDTDRALEWLDRAVRNGDERLEWFQRDPLLVSLRDHPRFKQILDVIASRRAQRQALVPSR